MQIVIPRPSGNGSLAVKVSKFELVRMVAYAAGYDDIDVDPSPNHVKITVSSQGKPPFVASGSDETSACDDFLNRICS